MIKKEEAVSSAEETVSPTEPGYGFPTWDFRNSPEISGHALWEWDVENSSMRFSPEWRQILRQPDNVPLDSSFASWRPYVHEEDIKELLRMSDSILAGEADSIQLVFRLQRYDGCWAWLLSRGSVTERKDGRPVCISGVVMDISFLRTDAKFQQGNVGVGDDAYHAMLENSPDLVVRMDRELFPLYMNPVVARYMGRQRHEYSFDEDLDELKIDPKQLDFLKRNVDRVFSEGIAVREMATFMSAIGEVTGEYSFWPEFDADGQVIFAMTQFRDLTEQVEAEQRARLNERRLDALYKLTQMVDLPEKEVMRFVLHSLIQLTGSGSGFIFIPDGDEVTGSGHMVWSDDHYDFIEERFLPGDSFPGDLVCLAKDEEGHTCYRCMNNGDGVTPIHMSFEGRMKIMRNILAPAIEDGRVVCVAGVCNKKTDYTEADVQQLEMFISGAWLVLRRHNDMRDLLCAKEAAEHANKVKDEFLANVSHELRTPLNGLLSMLQLLDFLPLTEQQREYVRTANLSGKALLRIISDILDFSRMESGKMELQYEPFDLKQTVSSTLSLFRGEAEKKGLEFTMSIDGNIPACLMGDDARVRQIIFNVVGNALKFTERGGIHIDCVLLSPSLRSGENGKAQVKITVKDTGIGIPEALQSAIFEAFTQVDSSSSRKYAGTGLGLGIVKGLVTMMNGHVKLESEEGVGTVVDCVLEFSHPCQGHRPVSEKGLPEPGTDTPLDILVAEDDSVSRFAIRSFLARMGHKPLCVSDGTKAIEALKLYSFHCLFTDIQMPDMDGIELARRIRNNMGDDIPVTDEIKSMVEEAFPGKTHRHEHMPHDIAIVAVSAHAMSGDKERFLKQGMDYYISKPIVAEELAETLKRLAAKLAAEGKLEKR